MGDIVECGVFKGSGIMVWLKILDMNEPNSVKKVIGFDHFNRQFIDNLKNKNDREPMEQVFDRCHITDETCFDVVTDKINNAKVNPGKYELIQGDIIETSKGILSRPGLRISILYMDLDLDEPTYATLKNLWSRVVSGGFVIFDEYAYHVWSESNAVDRFVKEYNLKLNSTFIKAPSAYIIKP
jgi:hypothetical protein